jgi:hypothetical protein
MNRLKIENLGNQECQKTQDLDFDQNLKVPKNPVNSKESGRNEKKISKTCQNGLTGGGRAF